MITIIIPEYPREVRLSEKRRTLYYKLNSKDIITVEGKIKGKPLPEKYKSQTLTYNKEGRVCTKDLFGITPIIANPKAAGTPRIKPIKFNDLWAGGLGMAFTRVKITETIKEAAEKYLLEVPPVEIDNYPLFIEIRVHDTIENPYDKKKKWFQQRWDGYNLVNIYQKTLIDLLKTKKIIIDDDRLYVTDIGYFVPLPVDKTHKDRYIEIIIKKNEMPEVINNTLINEFYATLSKARK